MRAKARRYLFWLLLGTAVCIAGSAGLMMICAWRFDRVTRANYDRIRIGMTDAEVEAILGPEKLCEWGESDYMHAEYIHADYSGLPRRFHCRTWSNERHRITVLIDDQEVGPVGGRVVGKDYTRRPGANVIQLVIDRLGL